MAEEDTETANHGYRIPQDGEPDWHIPLNANFEKIDINSEIRDLENNLGDYDPKANAKFLATDTGTVYVCTNGSSWTELGTIGSDGDGGDPTTTEGVANIRNHAGPLTQGIYHDVDAVADTTWGVAFAPTNGLFIDSGVVDVDLSSSTRDVLEIEFYQVDSRDANGIYTPSSPIDTVTTPSLKGGPERIDLGFTVPDDDGYSEYCLAVNHVSDGNGNYLTPRFIESWNGWKDYSDPEFDLLQGGRLNDPTNSEYDTLYAYLFDIAYGDVITRVTSPWSHDVEEIYMRPRDPEEEFDSISPRALWIDTS